MILDKSQMTEEDIKLNYITPAIITHWQNKVTMETQITDGRVNIKGNLVTRDRPKKADYVLWLNRDKPIAVVEAKDNHHPMSYGLQQAITYAQMLDDVDVDMLMFSVNPAYDYGQGEYANGSVDERSEVYRRCEKDGIGISVMKPFSGEQLLTAEQSPFGQALTMYQCIRYALDKPGILTVLPGAQSVEEIENLLAYYDQPEEALDYSVIGSFAPPQANGKCVYCDHCKPCPVGIDIGLVNKYYDLNFPT